MLKLSLPRKMREMEWRSSQKHNKQLQAGNSKSFLYASPNESRKAAESCATQ